MCVGSVDEREKCMDDRKFRAIGDVKFYVPPLVMCVMYGLGRERERGRVCGDEKTGNL